MKSPPAGVKLVMAAVCVMKDIKPEKINDPDKPGQKVGTRLMLFLFVCLFFVTYFWNLVTV